MEKLLLLFTLSLFSNLLCSQHLEKRLREFEKQDSIGKPGKGVILFTGSSSIQLWHDLEDRFKDTLVLNRGISGTCISDLLLYADTLILQYTPSAVVIYSGGNDLAKGKKPETVFSIFQSLITVLRDSLPTAKIIYISIKSSPSRVRMTKKIKQTNHKIQSYISKDTSGKLEYLDVFTPMLNNQKKPREELFSNDNLHMNERGYDLWEKLLRERLNLSQKQVETR